MRALYLIFIIFLSFPVRAQKKYEVIYSNPSYQQFIKHPKTEFKDSLSVLRYLKSLQNEAISKGYLLASVDKLTFKNRTAVVNFHLGDQFKYAQVSIDPEELKFLRRHSRLNERLIAELDITPSSLASSLTSIRDTYLNNGYPFVSVQLQGIEFRADHLVAELKINRGKRYIWKEIHVKGDSSVSKKYVSNLIGIQKGDEYQEDLLLKISNRIKQVPFLEEIRNHEILFSKDGSELYVYVKNVPISSVNGIVGFQPNPVTQQLSITGELNLKLQNVLRRGELLDVRWQSIRDQTQSLNLRVNYPFLFKTSFGLDGSFDLYKRDTSFLELKMTAGIQYFLNQGSYIKAFYQNLSSNVLAGGQNNPLFSKLGSTTSNSYGLAYSYQQVDYLPNPSKGMRILLSGSAGTRKSRISDTSQVVQSLVFNGDLDIEFFIPLSRRHVLRLANRTQLYNAATVFENEVFRFGGLTSQRGFNEDELFATTLSVGTLEYRFLLDRNSHVFAFYDQTLYENNAFNYYQDQPFGFGVGFAFNTNLGVFSISYALGKQFDNTVLLSNGKVHFGYIAYF